jgi:hypothetical protein
MSERPKRQVRSTTTRTSYAEMDSPPSPKQRPPSRRVKKDTETKTEPESEAVKKPVRVSIYQGRPSISPKEATIDTFHHPLSYGDSIERSSTDTAVMNYGRFQPPTIGHGVLVNEINDIGTDAYIFITPSCNDAIKYQKTKLFKELQMTQEFESCKQSENPLSAYQRTFYMKTMFQKDAPRVRFINCVEKGITGPIQAIQSLTKAGYLKIIFKCGSDRVPDFKFLESMFRNKVFVEQAGDIRDEEGVITTDIQPNQMSGTKMRLAAVEGKILSFKRGLMVLPAPSSPPEYIGYMTDDLALQLMNDIRDGLHTQLKPLKVEELVQLGGKASNANKKRAFQRFVKRWISKNKNNINQSTS